MKPYKTSSFNVSHLDSDYRHRLSGIGHGHRSNGFSRSSQRLFDFQARATASVDLITASGSGLDPHISPASAEYQVDRVTQARNLTDEKARELVLRHTESR